VIVILIFIIYSDNDSDSDSDNDNYSDLNIYSNSDIYSYTDIYIYIYIYSENKKLSNLVFISAAVKYVKYSYRGLEYILSNSNSNSNSNYLNIYNIYKNISYIILSNKLRLR